MYAQRNDLSPISQKTTLQVRTRKYECGYWGKHQPPYIDEDGYIVIDIGVGYKSSRHLHGQNVYVLDVDDNMVLIEITKFGDMYGAGLWHYLLGEDNGHPWIAHIPKTIGTVAEAVQYLKPAAVKRAENNGLEVKRQGDWFFIPVRRPHHSASPDDWQHGLDGDHHPGEMLATKSEWAVISPDSGSVKLPAGTIYVRGRLDHSQHNSLFLDGWHKAVRNKAIRTGRFARIHGRID